MQDEMKAGAIVALVGGAAGIGLAVGFGLRQFSTLAVVGLGLGIAIGIASRPRSHALSERPQLLIP